MKTKLTSFLSTTLLLCSISTSMAFASESFYEKDLVRGFISFGADYRSMNSAHIDYINDIIFNSIPYRSGTYDTQVDNYGHFGDTYVGMHFNIGAEYKQLMSWFNINFMPTQVSKKPASIGDFGDPLYDARWFSYGLTWMFGWKLLNENSVINIIPSTGLGMNLLNVHFPSMYGIITKESGYDPITGVVAHPENNLIVKNRYYSNFASTVNAELEVRLNLDPISVGLYGGYRYIRYSEFNITYDQNEEIIYVLGSPDANGDTWFIGARVTWTFLSKKQSQQKLKL